jgi:hypothetical protein
MDVRVLMQLQDDVQGTLYTLPSTLIRSIFNLPFPEPHALLLHHRSLVVLLPYAHKLQVATLTERPPYLRIELIKPTKPYPQQLLVLAYYAKDSSCCGYNCTTRSTWGLLTQPSA